MTIREFVRTVWLGKYYVLVAVLVVVAAALFYLRQQDTVYEAVADVEISAAQTTTTTGDAPPVVTVATSPDDVTSDAVVAAAVTALGYTGDPAALAAQVSAEPASDDGSLVAISATSLDPQESVDIANAFATAYVAQLTVIQTDQVAKLSDRKQALTEQLQAVTGRLAADPTDPLATAEQDAIVSDYQSLVTQSNLLTSITEPGTVASPATGASPQGFSSATVILIAIMAGLVAGVGLAFAKRGLDLHVQKASEASRLTGAPVLAELFGVRAADHDFQRSRTLPISSKVATPFTESIRELRTAVQVSLSDDEHIIVVVTAADPHAPRSFIAANLAASFALSGRRTIAVSGDLRRPQLDKILPPPAGWSGEETSLRPTDVLNLSVFPVPVEEMDPADYLATTRARQLIEELRDQADVVVVDAPPVLAAADATILGRYASGVVVIASAGKTDRAVLTEAVDRLRINNVPLAGLALAGVKSDRRMLYASTYGEDRSQGSRLGLRGRLGGTGASVVAAPAEEAAADLATTARPDGVGDVGVDGSTGAGDVIVTPSRGSTERAAAVVTKTAENESESSDDDALEDAPDDERHEAPDSAGESPSEEPSEKPAAAQGSSAPSTSSNGRSVALLSPAWSKVPTGSPSATDTEREGAAGSATKTARKGPFRW